MSTTPATSPLNVTPASLAMSLYQAFAAAYNVINAATLAETPAGGTATLTIPSLVAIQQNEALAAAGFIVTDAQWAAVLVKVPVQAGTAPATPPPYVLGRTLAPGLFVLDSNGPFPSVGTVITISGVNYLVGALTPFEFTATQLA